MQKSKVSLDYYTIEKHEVNSQAKDNWRTVWCCGIVLKDGEIVHQVRNTRFCAPFRGHVVGTRQSRFLAGNPQITFVESTVSEKHAEKLAVEARQAWIRAKLNKAPKKV